MPQKSPNLKTVCSIALVFLFHLQVSLAQTDPCELRARPDLPESDYVELRKDSNTLSYLNPYPGRTSLVGLYAIGAYRSAGSGDSIFEGWVVQNFGGGFGGGSIVGLDGKVRDLGHPYGFETFRVQPEPTTPQWTTYSLKEAAELIRRGGSYYGTVTVAQVLERATESTPKNWFEPYTVEPRSWTVTGKLSLKPGVSPAVILIEEASGIKHEIGVQVPTHEHFRKIDIASADAVDLNSRFFKDVPQYAKPLRAIGPREYDENFIPDVVKAISPNLEKLKNLGPLLKFVKNCTDRDLFDEFTRLHPERGLASLQYSGSKDRTQVEGQLFLLTPSEVAALPAGTPLWTIQGMLVFKDENLRLDDVRRGVTSYGVRVQGFHQLGDAIQYMDKGLSAVATKDAYERFIKGKPFYGRSDGQFMTTKQELDLLIEETKGASQSLADALGLGFLGGERLYRIDVPNPWPHRPRLPSHTMSGANSFFVAGGKTSGGLYEIALDPIPAAETRQSVIAPIGSGNPSYQ